MDRGYFLDSTVGTDRGISYQQQTGADTSALFWSAPFIWEITYKHKQDTPSSEFWVYIKVIINPPFSLLKMQKEP